MVERQFVAEAVEQEVVDDVDVLVDALGRLHPVVAAGGTGVHPHDGVLGHVDQCPVEEDLGVGPHDRIVVEVAQQPVVLNVHARVLRRVLLLAVDIAAEVVGGVAGGPRSGVAEEGIAEVVPVVVGLGRVVLDRSTVERLVGIHLGQQHGHGEDLQLVVLGAVVVVRRARHPGVVVLDVEAHAVPVVGLEDAIPVHDQRVRLVDGPVRFAACLDALRNRGVEQVRAVGVTQVGGQEHERPAVVQHAADGVGVHRVQFELDELVRICDP